MYPILIPARYSSSRFPGKPLVDIHGVPMIVRVALNALKTKPPALFVLTDDSRIADVLLEYSIPYLMTSRHHITGTDRLAEAINFPELQGYDYFINLQGDEQFCSPQDILSAYNAHRPNPSFVVNGSCKIE